MIEYKVYKMTLVHKMHLQNYVMGIHGTRSQIACVAGKQGICKGVWTELTKELILKEDN